MAESKKSKPVMDDVAKPGETPAEATSRPLIVGKGPAIKDPMVNDEATSPGKVEEKPLQAPSTVKKVITPLADDSEQRKTPAAKAVTEPEVAPDSPAESEEDAKETDDSEAQPKVDKVSEEDLKRQELAAKLIAEKTYFVPIGAVKRKRKNRIAVLFLTMLVLAAAGAVAAIDAELIDSNITLPFDLIK